MTAERWHQVRDILYAASRFDGEARFRYLDENCAADTALLEEVKRLLSALDQSDGFLEPDARNAQDPRIFRIGPYLILGHAGHGGIHSDAIKQRVGANARPFLPQRFNQCPYS